MKRPLLQLSHVRHAALLVSCVIALSAWSASPAQGQRLGGQRFNPGGAEDAVLGTYGADRRVPWAPYFALWGNYALRPVVVRSADDSLQANVVEHAVATDLVASVAVWEGLELGVMLPITWWSSGDDMAVGGLPNAVGLGLGDLRLRAAYRVRLSDDTAMALHLPVLLPTSASNDVLATGLGVRPTWALMQRLGFVELYVNLSYLFREEESVYDLQAGDELGARLAARVALEPTWQTAVLLEAGLSTSVRDAFAAAETPAEARLGLEHWFAQTVRLTGFVGTALSTGVGAPDLRAGLGIAFGHNPPYRPRPAPTSNDQDGDGVDDDHDRCPQRPEDPDGYQDRDGCPDPDNDRDGIADVEDDCPDQPETHNDISDEDGCPDLVRIEGSLIVTFEPIHFRPDSEQILPRSHGLLNEVAGVMKVNPDMRIRVEGHSDAKGPSRYNLKLSKKRAESVREYLIDQGVDSKQLTAVGRGERRPTASNVSARGRARNRRVEFHIHR